ncbi:MULTISPECIES: NAD(P)/FAD-dependent oxidoreductase [Enterococcus]|uniref:Flavoprotein n=2 Tax=Enterococcus TaxID=1350 RepID=R3WRQ1_9ENTE|nr:MULTISPECIES: NAD(P)/FAD-dependent oxidoreductase [Enterococcus]EOL44480.1 flavoprotein [Enterococcus caccae ATCC BAA-1240]EOT68404.1 flavoprotein [Enterococcus caccae ATCC BAA-1240]MBO0440243.1 NAD(P)/FAD-dependent oxidoreductase [Enterococcus sp. DIV0869a]OJG28388.1 flavoprotein [Enterococcus caccae]
MKCFDVIVVGAGTSGMMAAIAAAKAGSSTLLIEKNKRVGKKLLLTGGGRCNVTNNRPADEIIAHIPGNGKFLYSAFSQFNNYDIMEFFESNGTHLKEEDHGRMFPVTDRSKTIVETLFNQLEKLGVTIYTEAKVEKVLHKEGQIIGVALEHEKIYAPCVILTTGGRTYPSTGSTGDGYKLAKRLGHTISPLYATESPIVSNDDFITEKTLQGLSLQDVALSVLNSKGKVIVTHQMDLLFTHFGVSGPAALRCSSFVNQELVKNEHKAVTLQLDIFPQKTALELKNEIQRRLLEQPEKALKNSLKNLVAERLLDFVLNKTDLSDYQSKQISEQQLDKIVQCLKSFRINAAKTLPIEKSFVTGGGISLKEIHPKTMESKLVNGLFFAGELLDINGYTGGYNVTAAFVTGHVAGTHAANIADYTFLPSVEQD